MTHFNGPKIAMIGCCVLVQFGKWWWETRTGCTQGGPGNGKIDPGSKKNLRPLRLDLPTYVIRHTSIYGSVTYVASSTRGNHGTWFPQQCQRFPHHKCESHHHTTTIRHPRNKCSCSFSESQTSLAATATTMTTQTEQGGWGMGVLHPFSNKVCFLSQCVSYVH